MCSMDVERHRPHPLYPAEQRRARALGDRLRLARLRRRMPQAELALRADTNRTTLWRLERGDLRVSLETLVRVLSVLGLDSDLDLLAQDDELGRRLQDQPLRRARRQRSTSPP
ncbi:MAG: helix-turn-helix domain-containing protein [Candidatus Dormibacteria bacterium]